MNTPKYIAIVALVLALSLSAAPVSASGGSASMKLTPPIPNPGLIDDDVNFALVVDVAFIDPGVAGIEIYLSYDNALVAPPASPIGVVEPLPDFFGASNVTIAEILPVAQCPGGTSSCIHLVAAGPAQITNSGAVARFHFRGIAEGTACFRVMTSLMKDADGYPIDHTAADPVCVTIIRRTILKGAVLRQGTPGNPNPGGGTLACSEVWSTSGGIRFGPVFTDGVGNFKLTKVTSGGHILHAEYSGYLGSEKSITIGNSGPTTIDVWITTLRGGDVNNDNAINILDIGTIISKFGKAGFAVRSASASCSGADEAADINDDSLVNISDLAIAAGNWGSTEPTAWP